MRIAYISSSPSIGLEDHRGPSTHVRETVRALEAAGHDVSAWIAGGVRSPSFSENTAAGIRRMLPGYVVEGIRNLRDLRLDRIQYGAYLRRCIREKPDFLYERYVVFHRAGVSAAGRCGVPLLLEVNAPLQERDIHYGKRARPLARRHERRVFEAADAVVAVSSVMKEYVMSHGIDGSKVHVIPNGVDTDFFHPGLDGSELRRRYAAEGRTVVGFVGGFNKWHGIEPLLTASFDLLRGGANLSFLLVGDGPLRTPCEALVRRQGFEDRIHFPGAVPFERVPAHVASMDITIMPSSNPYGSPLKIFEYMAMGKAVIAPRVGPVVEVMNDGEHGLLVTPDDVLGIRNAVKRLAGDDAFRRRLARQARERVVKNHTWLRNAERIVDIYRSL